MCLAPTALWSDQPGATPQALSTKKASALKARVMNTAKAIMSSSYAGYTLLKQGVNETATLSCPVLHFVPQRP